MTSAFVTGATGFLGRHLCAALRARGVTVHEYRRDQGDIAAATAMCTAIGSARPDCVFHLAADTRRDVQLPEMFQTNVVGTQNVLQAAGDCPVVVVGSFEEYGDCPTPFREDMAPQPRSPYGISKAIATALATARGATVIRLPVVYGPGQPPESFIGGLCAARRAGKRLAMSPGEQTRDFLFVSDAVTALLLAGEKFTGCRGEIFNACTGQPVSLREVAIQLGDIADFGALPYRENEQMRYVGDPGKIQRALGWRAKVSLSDGLCRTLAGDTQQ
ncbi:MAG: GDP-6-deoxy-D-mannose reductase [Verrucomicrobiae bacterium]|nr:GDP-6-deoxy-D-mannose reductase [Verrucomicrobiae bacterium]